MGPYDELLGSYAQEVFRNTSGKWARAMPLRVDARSVVNEIRRSATRPVVEDCINLERLTKRVEDLINTQFKGFVFIPGTR